MKKFALIGSNISYSFSPILHKTIFDHYSINATYSIIDNSNLKSILSLIKENNIDGFNVTIPFKEEIIPLLDHVSSEALSIGAVNCVKIINDKTYGFNTDYLGLLDTFKKMQLNLNSKNIYILGSGGAAKASWKAVIDCGGNPIIVSRNIKKNDFFKNTSIISYEELESSKGLLLINATPIGTYPNITLSPVNQRIVENFDFLLDLIYNPKETKFLKDGKFFNKICENGLFMLISQGVNSEKIWNNIEIDTNSIYSNLIPIIYKK